MLHALHYIKHEITQLLGLADEVHEEDTFLIALSLIIDIENICVTELIAEIVDLTFLIICSDD